MKTRSLILILALLSSLLAFASCEKECEHSFSEAWTSDATSHWHSATCEHGELNTDKAEHVDEDQNSKCDVCDFETKHTHTYAKDWSFNETHHWKAATCLHTDEKVSYALHADTDLDTNCDSCGVHIHTLDVAGYCIHCDEEVEPISEADLASVINALTARAHNITSGAVDYYMVSRLQDENAEMTHLVEYYLGTNGTYSKRSYDEVETLSDNTVVKTGKTELLEKWIKVIDAETVEGISAISVDGIYKSAEPTAFGTDDLAGYYYAVSTLADGHGPEAVLLALYDAYEASGYGEMVITHDAEGNKYDLEFNVLVVHVTVIDGENHYNVNYYELAVSFTYSDDYVLTSLDITCDCYTNDPGTNAGGRFLEEEVDLDYNVEEGTFTLRDGARADTYVIKTTQTAGERVEIELNDGAEFTPDDFELFLDDALTETVDSLEFTVGNNDVEIFIGATPENTFFAFLINDLEIIVKDADGNVTNQAINAFISGNLIYFIPLKPGEYTIEFTAIGKTKTVSATVDGLELGGEHTFEVTTTTAYEWVDFYEFVPETYGVYTFYLPAYLGIWLEKDYTSGAPLVDAFNFDANMGYKPEVEHTFTVTLRPGQTLRFYFGANTIGTFLIGYDAP